MKILTCHGQQRVRGRKKSLIFFFEVVVEEREGSSEIIASETRY